MKPKILMFTVLLMVLFLPAMAFAQGDDEEEITLTTYYPAPYGEYDKLYVDSWIQLDRSGLNTGELRLAAPDAAGSGTTIWNLHNRGSHFGGGSITGGDGNKLYLTYYDGSDWFGPHLVVTPAGNVGIGTPAPNYKFHVEGAGDVALLARTTTDNTGMARIRLEGVGVPGTNGGALQWTESPTLSFLDLTTYSGVSPLVLQASGGNVGIGTTNPTNGKLEVSGEISTGDVGIKWKRYIFSISSYSGVYTDSGVDIDIDPSKIISITGALNDSLNKKIGIGTGNPGERWGILIDSSGNIWFVNTVSGWQGTNNAQILVFYED